MAYYNIWLSFADNISQRSWHMCIMNNMLNYYHHESSVGVDKKSIVKCLGTLYAGTY